MGAILSGLAACAILVGAARAQDGGQVGEVIVEIVDNEFGVGGVARGASWAGIRLRISDASSTARELLVRLSGRDPDGDTPWFEQVVAGGGEREAWTYLKIPTDLSQQEMLQVTVFEAIATEDAERAYRPGRFLARVLVSPRVVVPISDGLIGVLNSRGSFGLTQYSLPSNQGSYSPLANERTEVVSQLSAEQLPDRWMGLSAFEALVWGDADPSVLGTERPRAIVEWIERGGHLIVVLPEFSQIWTDARANPLYSVLPRVSVLPVSSGYDADRLIPLFDYERRTRTLEIRDPSVVVRELAPDPRAGEGEAITLLEDPDGRVLVARRIVGQGMVTLIGINLNARGFLKYGLPRAEAFWNRILGRRGRFASVSELNDPTTSIGRLRAMSRLREERWYDDDVGALIATSGRAAAALTLAFVTFAVYWALAGPLGYAILKRLGQERHAWVAFVGTAGVFTAIAWSGAYVLRPKKISARHVSIIDHVYGQDVDRAITWMSLLVPYYGEATVRVGEDDPGRFHNVVSPWMARKATVRGGRFPDVRGYRIDARDPDRITFPARSTVKQLEVIWAGEPLRDWRMPRPMLGDQGQGVGASGEPALTLDERGFVRGVLRHNLPGDLTDVVVIGVRRQASVGARLGGNLIVSARAAKRLRWAPGEEWDLSAIEASAWEPLSQTLDALVPEPRGVLATGEEMLFGTVEQRMLAMSLFHMLETPRFGENSAASATIPRRWQTHAWDLSRWLTQPCVIVIGHLADDAPAPTPMGFGASARAIPTSGRTLVRWVYPLAGDPPDWVEDEGDG